MTNDSNREMCLVLMHADTEEEVIDILRQQGYWDDGAVWRYYGDRETNYNTIGNQQSSADAALVEKLVNAIDARLINECVSNAVEPEGSDAPGSILEAVARFFGTSGNSGNTIAGLIRNWTDSKRTEVARGITLAATGHKPPENPCFTIADKGEGQTPDAMPTTLLSLDRGNKKGIPFVQGVWNMGGTGALQFCGRHGLQLVVSRRNPNLQGGGSQDWGFSVVRREDPAGGRRTSVYTYLAPLGANQNPHHGEVLRFAADTMPLFPDGQNPYAVDTEWGTLIKLYEYGTHHRTHMFRRDGILERMNVLLPELALPIRLHECRDYGGHRGSYETTLTGLRVRLEDDRQSNLEQGFPASSPFSAGGEKMIATIYAFRKGRADSYRKNEGIIFTVNGQTHGHFTKDFFRRKKVGLSYLAESILVVVDCGKFTGRAREDLFMNSRDRLSKGVLRREIESAIEDLLKNHDGLRALKERRRREELESRLADSKPLEQVLESLLRKSPTLSQLFLQGNRASTPFKSTRVRDDDVPYQGKRFPTYFRFKKKAEGEELRRNCSVAGRARVAFETDADNDYFSRETDPGEFTLYEVGGGTPCAVTDYGLNLLNGAATLSVKVPDTKKAGEAVQYLAVVTDPSRVDPFENRLTLTIVPKTSSGSGKKRRKRPPTKENGDDTDSPSQIAMPPITRVREAQWDEHSPPFDKETALRVKHAGTQPPAGGQGKEVDVYDFYINMDNVHLKRFAKYEAPSGQDDRVTEAQFETALVLTGLAMIHGDLTFQSQSEGNESGAENGNNGHNIEDDIDRVTRSLAPFILPMIQSLGSLDEESVSASGASGEAV